MKVAKDGGEPVVLASGLDIPWAIAVDATDVVRLSRLDGSVGIVAKDGGRVMTLATGQQWPLDVVIVGDDLS